MLTREQAEALLAQAIEHPRHDEAGRAKLRNAAKRNHEREAEGFREFAAIDQAAYATRLAEDEARAAADLYAAQGKVAAAEDNAAAALQAERAAEDRWRAATEHARQMQEAWKRVRGRGTPREQTDALVASQAADQVAQGEQAACEGKAAARTAADGELAAARAQVTQAEEALRIARERATHPGRAPYSAATCQQNVIQMVRNWESLLPVEQQHVKNTIKALAHRTGLFEEIKLAGGNEREAELEKQRPGPGAFTYPGAVPGLAGR